MLVTSEFRTMVNLGEAWMDVGEAWMILRCQGPSGIGSGYQSKILSISINIIARYETRPFFSMPHMYGICTV